MSHQPHHATGTATESAVGRDLLAIAVDAALSAADAIAGLRDRELSIASKSSPTDLVTALDRESEAVIAACVLDRRPQDSLMGEEGLSRDGTTGIRWVVDPLDGTVNAVYGQPAWAISIAAEDDRGTLAGVVAAPALGEAFTAVRGEGATAWAISGSGLVSPRALAVSDVSTLGMTLLATGFAYDLRRRQRHAAVVGRLLSEVRDIRRLGAAALDLCFVAAGRVDAYVEEALMPWDLAAGRLIAEEAGGLVRVLESDGPGVGLVVASGPRIHDALLAAVAAARDTPPGSVGDPT